MQATTKKLKTVAFVTYNLVGHGELPSGWIERDGRRALIVQNTNGMKRAGSSYEPSSYSEGYVRQVSAEVARTWLILAGEIQNLDHIVVYLGSKGSLGAITLAAQLPSERVTLVDCGCAADEKAKVMRTAGMGPVRRINCECGGDRTMHKLFKSFIETGALEP